MPDPGIIAVSIPIVALGGAFLTAIVATLAKHQQKMAELRLQTRQGIPDDLRAEFGEMKQQMSEMRETSTRFDMSFDAALTRIEERVDHLETRQAASRNGQTAEADTAAILTPRA